MSGAIEVRALDGKRDRDRFVMFPWSIYENDPYWVAPLISDEKKFIDPAHNPFFEHGEVEHYLAWRGDKVVGRIAAIENRLHNEVHEDRVGFFGMFECENDPEVAHALLDAASKWVGARGLDTLRGPMNYSTNDPIGLMIKGFDTLPYIMMTHNPPYYEQLVEGAGFTKAKDLLAYTVDEQRVGLDRLERVVKMLKRRPNMKVRSIDPKRWDDEVGIVRDLYNQAWEKNWGFVPFTPAEFDHMAKEMKRIVNPHVVAILEDEGRPVGFGLALPDMNLALRKANGRLFPLGLIKILIASRKINRVRVPILGILEEYRGKGYDLAMVAHIVHNGLSRGYHTAEMSWILEDNFPMIRGLDKIGGEVERVYRIYDRAIP